MKPGIKMTMTTMTKTTTTMKTTILACVLSAGLASAQNIGVIQNTRTTMQGVSNRATAASNEALSLSNTSAPAGSAAPAPVKKPAAAPSAKSIALQPATTKASVAAKPHRRHVGSLKAIVAVPAAVPAPAPAPAANPADQEKEIAGGGHAEGGESEAAEQPAASDGKYSANGRRDPFISPVVSHASGSGCSTGKKCLEIGTVNLRGIVRSEAGFIAVVSNGLNKAYFLRENDPVFNGYVMKITGDSIVFQETLQDRLGKTFTREVVKKITTPAV